MEHKKRKSLSKKTRFEVFKRDGFQCAYCGQSPPSVVLEVDHIEPISKGGTDDVNNLITACFDCNRGKSNNELNHIIPNIVYSLEMLKEKEAQFKAYHAYIRRIEKLKLKLGQDIEDLFIDVFPGYKFADHFKKTTILNFINKLPIDELKDSMTIALGKKIPPENTIKYFCGVCWRKIECKNSRFYR